MLSSLPSDFTTSVIAENHALMIIVSSGEDDTFMFSLKMSHDIVGTGGMFDDGAVCAAFILRRCARANNETYCRN